MLTDEARQEFERLNSVGQEAKSDGNHELAAETFAKADQLASEHHDDLKRLHALNPWARALWSLGQYDEAEEKLQTALRIAEELELPDERGIAISNLGRLAAVRIIRTFPEDEQAEILRREAVPKFTEAYEILAGHEHLYYRYANASHGSVVAILAGDKELADRLVIEGHRVAYAKPTKYDEDRDYTYEVNKKGVYQLGIVAAILASEDDAPELLQRARDTLVS